MRYQLTYLGAPIAVNGSSAITFTLFNQGSRALREIGSSTVSFAQIESVAIKDIFNVNGSTSIAFSFPVTKGLRAPIGVSNLLFTQTDTVIKSRLAQGITAVNFTQQQALNVIKNLNAITSIQFNSGGYLNNFVFNRVYFLFPCNGPFTQIELPRPLYGDSDNITLQTIVRHSRNGERHSYKRTPTYETLKMDFDNVPFGDLQELKNFFELTAALEVRFIDHYGRHWCGIILTDPISFVSNGKTYRDCPGGSQELFSLSLEFEGERTT